MSKAALANQDKCSPDNISARQFNWGLIFILCLAAVTYLSIAFFWGKFSRAEVFFAECSREMLMAGNFITPLYHGQPFFDKPIFVYWCIIAMFKWLGINHFAARLPSVIASLTTIAATALAGSYLYGRRAGLIAAGMLGSAFMYLSFSSLCMSDMFLVMFDVLSLIAIYAGIKTQSKRSLCWWLAAASMGFAFLAKGPVGLVLPAVSSLIYLALTKNLGMIKINHVLLALVTIVVIASPWFYAAYLANGSSALIYFFVHENVQRFAGAAYDAHKPFGYMIAGFFLGFAPWSILLPPTFLAFCGEIKKIWANFSTLPPLLSGELFLWLWVFVAVGFFCVSRGQCDYYTLPAYPAAAILAARYIDRLLAGACNAPLQQEGAPSAKDIRTINYSVPWIIILLCAVYTVITIVVGFLTTKFILTMGKDLASDIEVSGIALVAIPYSLLILTGAIIVLAIKQKYLATFAVATSGIFVLVLLFAGLILPQFNHLEPVDKYANLIKQGPDNLRVGTDKILASWIDEILFQSGKDPQRLDDLDQIHQFIAQDSPALLIMPVDKYNLLKVGKSWHIVASYRAITHSLTPGYIISRKGRIVDPIPVIVATNVEDTLQRHDPNIAVPAGEQRHTKNP